MKTVLSILLCFVLNNLCHAQVDLENKIIAQLNINQNRIATEYVVCKELPNNLNETVFVIPEIENEILDEDTELDYKLKGHILIVNSITGKIKYHYTDIGWESNAIFLSEIVIDIKAYKLTKDEVAFGIKSVSRSSSQPNPYGYTDFSLYIKEGKSLKKVLDNFVVDEYSGVVNVNTKICYADMNTETNELTLIESSTNGYYDIQVKTTLSNSIFEINSEGNCEDVEKSRVEKISILKYNNTKYE